LGVFRGVEIHVAEPTGVAFLVFGNTGVSDSSGLVEEGPKGVRSGVEGEVTHKEGLGDAGQMAVVGFGRLLVELGFGQTFGLFDDKVAAHVFATVLLESLVHVGFGSDFHEAEATGLAGSAVSDQFHVRDLAESAEEVLDIVLGGIVAQAAHFDFVFLVGGGSGLRGLGGRGFKSRFGCGFLHLFRFFFGLFFRRFLLLLGSRLLLGNRGSLLLHWLFGRFFFRFLIRRGLNLLLGHSLLLGNRGSLLLDGLFGRFLIGRGLDGGWLLGDDRLFDRGLLLDGFVVGGVVGGRLNWGSLFGDGLGLLDGLRFQGRSRVII